MRGGSFSKPDAFQHGPKKMEPEQFKNDVLKEDLSASIRYGYLYLRGNVNVSYSQANKTIKVTGGYGM